MHTQCVFVATTLLHSSAKFHSFLYTGCKTARVNMESCYGGMSTRSKQHVVTEFLSAENVTPAEIHHRLQAVYGEDTVNRTTVNHWAITFCECEPEKIQNNAVCRQDSFDCFLGLTKSFLLRWCYSPEWALASFTIRLQSSRSLALSLHSFIPILLRSVDTSSSHLIFGLPLRLVSYSFPYIFFGIAVCCILSI